MVSKKEKGITLIALVVTIIVLLILVGISVNMLTGQNGILVRSAEAKEQTKITNAKEEIEMASMEVMSEEEGNVPMDSLKEKLENNNVDIVDGANFPLIVKKDGGNFAVDESGEATIIPENLEIGSTVKYESSGTYDNWKSDYSGTEDTTTTTLNAKDGDFKIDTWRVLDIKNGNIILVPSRPASGAVRLKGEQGYNNGVKLLNDACSSLYSNSSKGITARSINIGDIEKYMLAEKVDEVHQYSYSESAKYGSQKANAYTGKNKNYPAIYSRENLSVINEQKKLNGLGVSEQTEFIEKTTDGATNGKITTAESIHPYQTYWSKDADYMQGAFKKASNGLDYKDLLIISGKNYWIASRCISTEEYSCGFCINCVYNGGVTGDWKCSSEDSASEGELNLFPIVTVKADLVKWDKNNGFTVNLN